MMKVGGKKFWTSVAIGAVLITTACHAQRGERLSRECRKEVVQLCGKTRDREAIGNCLREKKDQLSATCTQDIMKRIAERGGGAQLRQSTAGATEISYGQDAKQKLDFWKAPGASRAPLVVYVHGGGWSKGDKATGTGTKPSFYNGMGHAFASLNYRLVPDATVEQQAADIAAALAHLRANADKMGFDANQITLMGHSAGAHLVALVSSDTRYLEVAKVPVSAIKGTILLDGAGYDVAKQMAYPGNRVQEMYGAAFGQDPARQKALSPITHVGGADVGNWLLLHVERRVDAGNQSDDLARALGAKGVKAKVVPVPDATHMSVNKDAGVADSFVGRAIAGFLKG
jgi:arylformamidase